MENSKQCHILPPRYFSWKVPWYFGFDQNHHSILQAGEDWNWVDKGQVSFRICALRIYDDFERGGQRMKNVEFMYDLMDVGSVEFDGCYQGFSSLRKGIWAPTRVTHLHWSGRLSHNIVLWEIPAVGLVWQESSRSSYYQGWVGEEAHWSSTGFRKISEASPTTVSIPQEQSSSRYQ